MENLHRLPEISRRSTSYVCRDKWQNLFFRCLHWLSPFAFRVVRQIRVHRHLDTNITVVLEYRIVWVKIKILLGWIVPEVNEACNYANLPRQRRPTRPSNNKKIVHSRGRSSMHWNVSKCKAGNDSTVVRCRSVSTRSKVISDLWSSVSFTVAKERYLTLCDLFGLKPL